MCNWIITCAGRRCILDTCVLIKIDSGAWAWHPCDSELCLSHCPGTQQAGREKSDIQAPSWRSLKGVGPDWPAQDDFRKLLTLLEKVPALSFTAYLWVYSFQLKSGKWSWSPVESNDLLSPWWRQMSDGRRQMASEDVRDWACLPFKEMWLLRP